jgi:carbon-monoxide dehydrogenase large subunit
MTGVTEAEPAQPLRRVEDHRQLTGSGSYVADLAVPGCLEAAFVRSETPHGVIDRVETSAAAGMPGVEAVLTAEDLADVGDVPAMFGGGEGKPWPPLAADRVRFVGEALAAVVAVDRYRAEDATAAVAVEITPLPAMPTTAASLAAADPLYAGTSNVALQQEFGQPVAAATWDRAHVVEADYREQLLAPTSIEARAILVEPRDDGGLEVWCSHQFPHGLRLGLATALGLAPEQVRVIVPDAGGAFGSKSPTYPEYLAVAAAALRTRRPVRWVEDRTEALLAGSRGRGQDQHVRMAADSEGRILAIDVDVAADIGAHPLGAGIPMQTGLAASEAYAAPEVHARVR